jgi:serine/threonine-protein kinase
MDADLARVQRGVSVSPETEEAATQILSRPSVPITTPTSIAPSRQPPYAPPPVYYDYDEPPARRRPFWPWLLAVLLVALALVGGYLAFKQIQHQLNANKPVAVDDYIGLRESLARDKIKAAGLQPKIERQPSTLQPPTFVYDQDPAAGNHVAKGNTVTIFVSTGKPKTTVPDVRGRSSADAVGALRDAKLIPKVVEIHSGKPADTVTAQSPLPGKQIAEGSTVRINVSQGPQPVTVPAVVGEAYVQANSELQGAGFLVARHDQDSTEPAETVLAQSPVAGSQAARGSTVTVTVSKGPKSVRVPDVSNQSQADARAALEASGFHVSIEKTTTQDPNQDGFVLGQSPVGGTAAKPGTTVTITVGSYTPPAGGGGTTPVGPGTPTTTVPRVP